MFTVVKNIFADIRITLHWNLGKTMQVLIKVGFIKIKNISFAKNLPYILKSIYCQTKKGKKK